MHNGMIPVILEDHKNAEFITNGFNGFKVHRFDEFDRIEDWHKSICHVAAYNKEEIDAGIKKIQAWGFLNTLHNLSAGIWSEREIILNSSVKEVYTEIQRQSYIAAYEKRLREILKK